MSLKQQIFSISMCIFMLLFIAQACALSTVNFTGINTDVDFGNIEASLGAIGSISIGTNGNIAYSGSFSGPVIGTAGQVSFQLENGDNPGSITLECSSSVTLATSGGNTIPLNNIEYALGAASRGNFGTGSSCQGIGTTITLSSLSTSSIYTLYFGGQLDFSVPYTYAGGFSTANAGGSDITIVIIRI